VRRGQLLGAGRRGDSRETLCRRRETNYVQEPKFRGWRAGRGSQRVIWAPTMRCSSCSKLEVGLDQPRRLLAAKARISHICGLAPVQFGGASE
jgi:hypothetical protein